MRMKGEDAQQGITTEELYAKIEQLAEEVYQPGYPNPHTMEVDSGFTVHAEVESWETCITCITLLMEDMEINFSFMYHDRKDLLPVITAMNEWRNLMVEKSLAWT